LAMLAARREIVLTDQKMTRYFMTLHDVLALCALAESESIGAQVLLPRPQTATLATMASAVLEAYCASNGLKASAVSIREIGNPYSENIHERLVSSDECERITAVANYFGVMPVVSVPSVDYRPFVDPQLCLLSQHEFARVLATSVSSPRLTVA
jgi:FlaA1/EpsC-like NDP-sugar epimerase